MSLNFNAVEFTQLSSRILPLSDFKAKLRRKNKDFEVTFTLDENSYTGASDSIIVYTKYGDCLATQAMVLFAATPTLRLAINKTQYFKNKLLEYCPDYPTYYTILSKYIDSKTPLILQDEYGLHKMLPNTLLQGSKPSVKSAINPTQVIRNKVSSVFPEFFKTHSILHYEKASVIYIQDYYGILISTLANLTRKSKPTSSSAVDKTSYYMNKCFVKHQGIYDYTFSKVIDSRTRIKIICKNHGKYTQPIMAHLGGKGCKKCAMEITGYGNWVRGGEVSTDTAIFYVIKCFNETEVFYKIGITRNSLKQRYRYDKEMPYTYKLVYSKRSTCRNIWSLEVLLKRKLKKYHYTPKISFAGSITECYNYEYKEDIRTTIKRYS